jgi:hypothetical protein
MPTEVNIDIDINFDKFIASDHWQNLKIRIFRDVPELSTVYIRRSSSGNVHIRVKVRRDLLLLERLCLRAFLDDDPARLACDLDRFYRTGRAETTDRCFNKKYSCSQRIIKTAGVWQRVKKNGKD